MRRINTWGFLGILICSISYSSCKTPTGAQSANNQVVPQSYTDQKDTTNSVQIVWRNFFDDPYLVSLIDTAIKKNLDLMMAFQEMEVAKNNLRLRKGAMYPTITGVGSAGTTKVGHYTSQGAGDASAEITPGNLVPSPLNDYMLGLQTSWEADVWGKLRNSKKAAASRYLESIEGKNFVVTNLIASVANTYYELLALDNELEIIRKSIQLQKNGLEIIKVQKEAGAANELAVKQFEAQLYNSQSQEFDLLQQIAEDENSLNALLGRFPQKIDRDQTTFTSHIPREIKTGIPAQLLRNRPDIRQAEQELFATNCDVKAARAAFYPSLNLTGSIGFQAFKTAYLFTTPESLLYSIVGDLVVPLVNRSAIQADFNKANAYQLEALFTYQRSILNGFVEVSNELSRIKHAEQTFLFKSREADALDKAVEVSNDLFRSDRANHLELLTVQRDALSARLELIEAKKQQLNAVINIYKALGGGWQ